MGYRDLNADAIVDNGVGKLVVEHWWSSYSLNKKF